MKLTTTRLHTMREKGGVNYVDSESSEDSLGYWITWVTMLTGNLNYVELLTLLWMYGIMGHGS